MLELTHNECLAVNGAVITSVTIDEIYPVLLAGHEIIGWEQKVTMHRVRVTDFTYMDYPEIEITPRYKPLSVESYY